MNITSEILNKTFKKYHASYLGVKEDYFAALYISKKHEKEIEAIFKNCVFGNNDYGIDAYHIDKEARNLYLYQFKWSSSLDLFKDSYKRLINSGIERIFGNVTQDSKLNQTIACLKRDLDEYSNLINKVYVRFVFNGSVEKAQQSRALENLREDLEGKKYLLDKFFEGRDIQFVIEYLSNEQNETIQVTKTRKTFKYEIELPNTHPVKALNNEEFFLGFIKLEDLRLMFSEMKQRLFEKNIRAGLGIDRAPNKAIKKSLKEILIDKTLDSSYFTFYHNGITLFAENISFSDKKAIITEPRILNGAQTITTYTKFIEENDKHPALNKNISLLSEIKVLVKIISKGEPDFITAVTICNNRQNPVDPINLRACDEIQFEFEDKFRDELSIYYEHQENAFDNLLEEELEEMGINDRRQINIKKLSQTFLAIQGEVDRMSRLSDVFENESHYKATFKNEYLKKEAVLILLLYKVHFRVNSVIKSIKEKGYEKYDWVSYAKNLIWALLIQAILNDRNIDDLKEDYGKDLTISSGFTDYLKTKGSNKIRFILSDIVQQKKYSDFLEQEKFTFCRTKAVFQEAMSIAKRKYGWEKLSI